MGIRDNWFYEITEELHTSKAQLLSSIHENRIFSNIEAQCFSHLKMELSSLLKQEELHWK